MNHSTSTGTKKQKKTKSEKPKSEFPPAESVAIETNDNNRLQKSDQDDVEKLLEEKRQELMKKDRQKENNIGESDFLMLFVFVFS